MSELINKVNWLGLSCHDRALALGCERIKCNSFLAFLMFKSIGRDYLFRNHNMDIGDRQYYDYLSDILGIDIQLKVESSSYMNNLFTSNNNNAIVLVENSINNPETKMYRRENHPHFILVDKVDFPNKQISVIDENYDREFWKTENSRDGVEYIAKTYSFNQIVSRCQDVNVFSNIESDDADVVAFYILSKKNNKKIEIGSLISLFEMQLSQYSAKKESIMAHSLDIMLSFFINKRSIKSEVISDLCKRITPDEISRINNERYLYREYGNWFAFPYESSIADAHYKFIYSSNIGLGFIDRRYRFDNTLYAQIVEGFERLKIFVTRWIITPRSVHVDDGINLFNELLKNEFDMFQKWLDEVNING